MKYENILWGSVAWTTFIVLLPFPDWLTATLVIIGAVVVGLVAYGIGRDRRMFTKSSKEIKNVEEQVETLANEIADTLAQRPQMMNDVPREDILEETMRQALGDVPTIDTFAPTADEVIIDEEVFETVTRTPAEPKLVKPKAVRKRSIRHLTPEPADESAESDEA
jgi:hypothetical protein